MVARLLVGGTRRTRRRELLRSFQRSHGIIRRVNVRRLNIVRMTFVGDLNVGNITVREGNT